MTLHRKPIHFVGSAKKDLRDLPDDVQDLFGSALLDTQYGDNPDGARPFGEGVSRNVMKLIEDHDGDTYRAAYTASFAEAVYVLHFFEKKSKTGIQTPKSDKDLVEARLKAAEDHYRRTYGKSD